MIIHPGKNGNPLGYKIYPVKCKACGKGKIAEDN